MRRRGKRSEYSYCKYSEEEKREEVLKFWRAAEDRYPPTMKSLVLSACSFFVCCRNPGVTMLPHSLLPYFLLTQSI